ncbi:hypothetical protein V8E55_007495 [Tylopilus felleus]
MTSIRNRLTTLPWQLQCRVRYASRRTLFSSKLPVWTHRTHHPSAYERTSTMPLLPSEILNVRSILLRSPTLDVDLIPNSQVNVVLTDRAAEQIRRISTREGSPDAALRISVESGGCHGYQYKIGPHSRGLVGCLYHLVLGCSRTHHSLSHLTHPDIRPSNVYIDAVSLPMLNGSSVDYATEPIGSSFRVTGNPQAKGGCGCGVSWELNE